MLTVLCGHQVATFDRLPGPRLDVTYLLRLRGAGVRDRRHNIASLEQRWLYVPWRETNLKPKTQPKTQPIGLGPLAKDLDEGGQGVAARYAPEPKEADQDELARADLTIPPYQSSPTPLTVRPPNLRLGMGLPLRTGEKSKEPN
ncbi:hypothetical protein G6O67_008426 [Ophiocordyceps sinensis]|uniref:Uncharacterized protein n=1 Tax=Ophiocordyceps sinensis TaxID=72228 RepID=A0A8H4LSF8_9HYPO|nr:hypothetical protein G6O67_008426 [Ophiocordyceps sinensis]